MLIDHWPLLGLRLITPRLELRLPTDEELGDLADLAAEGMHDPGSRPFLVSWPGLPPKDRARALVQRHWRHRSDWSAGDWSLDLVNGSAASSHTRSSSSSAGTGRPSAASRHSSTASSLGSAAGAARRGPRRGGPDPGSGHRVRGSRAAQRRRAGPGPDAGHEFREVKWLGQVVVGAQPEALDPFPDRPRRGETAWNIPPQAGEPSSKASGGGVSRLFPRPAYQRVKQR
jgi:hypothetical protein